MTDRFTLKVTLQVPLPLQSPLQPSKVLPLDATAVSVTAVPAAKPVWQTPVLCEPVVIVQSIPLLRPDWLVTRPLPVPPPATLSWKVGFAWPLKTARTALLPSIRRLQTGEVPVQPFAIP